MIKSLLLLLAFSTAFADTPPPGTVKAKTWSGDGNTAITQTGGALDVNVTNASGLTTVNQGTGGSSAWKVNGSSFTQPVSGTFWQALQPVSGTLTCNAGTGTQAVSLATLPALTTGSATIGSVNINGTVPVSGTVTATNSSIGATGSAVPANATTVGGSDGTNLRALKVSSTGVLSVDGSASTQPVSGTFWQATQPVSGTFWQATQPVSGTVTANAGTGTFAVSAASLPLPSGASTSAKQPALGTAGTASSDVITVQGIASMTALKVDGSAVTQPVSGTFWQATQPVSGTFWQATQPVSGTVTANIGTSGSLALDASVTGLQVSQGSTTSGQKGGLALGAVTTAAPSYTTAQSSPLSLTTAGALRTDASASTQPISGTVTANAGTGNFTVVQATGTNLHTVVDSAPTTAVTQSGTWNVTNVSGTVSLPTGASTSSLQSTGNTSIASVDTKTPALGAAATAAASPVTLASDQAPSTGLYRTATGSFTATSQTVTINPSGAQTVQVQLSGTFSATYTMEMSMDGGTTWTSVFGWDQGNTGQSTTGNVSGRTYTYPAYGNSMRARCSTYTSGTMVVSMVASLAPTPATYVTPVAYFPVQGGVAISGTASGVQPLQVGGIFQTSPATLTNGQQGALQQDNAQNLKVTVNTALPAGTNAIGTVTAKAGTPTALTVKAAAVTIGTSAVRLTNDGAAAAATRVLLVAQLLSTSTANCFLGPSTVTSSGSTRGVQMFAGQSFSFTNDAGDYYAICDASSQTFFITEQE